jgi:hypothetical protein
MKEVELWTRHCSFLTAYKSRIRLPQCTIKSCKGNGVKSPRILERGTRCEHPVPRGQKAGTEKVKYTKSPNQTWGYQQRHTSPRRRPDAELVWDEELSCQFSFNVGIAEQCLDSSRADRKMVGRKKASLIKSVIQTRTTCTVQLLLAL